MKDKEYQIDAPKITDKLWEIVKCIDAGRLSSSFFESLTITGSMVVLRVNFRNISQMHYELREYIMPNDYMFDMFKHQYYNFSWPDNFEFSFRFGPYNFIVCKSMTY